MQEKKAQVTLFIILGIILVVGVITFFVIRGGVFSSNSQFPEVSSAMEKCIQDSTLEAVYYNSFQGGYSETPEPNFKLESFSVPIYLNKAQKNVPPIALIETELEDSIKLYLVPCVKKIELSTIEGVTEIKTGELKSVGVSITGKQIQVEVSYPIFFTREEESKQINSFEKKINFDFNQKYEDVEAFLTLQAKNPEMILFTQLEEFGDANKLKVEAFKLGNSSDYIYNFIYPAIKYQNRSYIYSFGVKY